MSVRTRRTTIAALLAGAVALAACGGSGNGDDGDGAPTTGGGASPTTAANVGTATLPPTTAKPVEDLPPCPVDALDAASGTVEIQFWHDMNDVLKTTLEGLTSRYNSSQDRVRVVLVPNGGYDDNFDKYRTAAAGDRPAIVQLPEYQVQTMVDSGTIIPAQSCVEASGFDTGELLDRATSYYSVDGALQAMPFNVSNPILYYNKTAFTNAGLDPEAPPKTLEELRSVSEQLVSSGAATYGLAFDTSPDGGGGWFIEQWFAKSGELFADGDNGRTTRATTVLFNTPTGVDLLTYMQSMVQDGLAVSVGRNQSATDVLFKLVDPAQPAAMGLNTSAALTGAIAAVPQFPGVVLGVGPMPGPEGQGGVLVGGAALWLVAGRDDPVTAAAWDYVSWLMAAEQQAEWSVGTGYVPVNTGALDVPSLQEAWAAEPAYRVAYDQVLGAVPNAATAGAILGPQRQVRESVASGFEAILGGADVAATLAKVEGEANTALEDYARRVGG
jgi:sn-glycerol 3-phosphate transport system substrate-binding protein